MALFHPKINLFVKGRKDVFSILEKSITKVDRVIWVHVASLGEFEQGLPVIERIKNSYPGHKLLVTFFSPSGYEVKKNTTAADIVTYLPIDTIANANKFMALVKPELALFVKYEIWPNYLKKLQEQGTPTLLISAIFNKRQAYFKWYGGMMRKALKSFSHFFVQNKDSVQLLSNLGFENVTVSGDTRFDRVSEILERNNELVFMQNFKKDQKCIVAGSTWPEDEKILASYINSSDKKLKFILAPHNIKKEHIEALKHSLSKTTLLYSELKQQDLSGIEVLIIDTIGLLTKIYGYADIAYVGGAFATGLHNTLEPAVFGIPVIIGPDYQGFIEAEALVKKKGILTVESEAEFSMKLDKLLEDPDYLGSTGKINSDFIDENRGASEKIMEHINKLIN